MSNVNDNSVLQQVLAKTDEILNTVRAIEIKQTQHDGRLDGHSARLKSLEDEVKNNRSVNKEQDERLAILEAVEKTKNFISGKALSAWMVILTGMMVIVGIITYYKN